MRTTWLAAVIFVVLVIEVFDQATATPSTAQTPVSPTDGTTTPLSSPTSQAVPTHATPTRRMPTPEEKLLWLWIALGVLGAAFIVVALVVYLRYRRRREYRLAGQNL